jgi:hypothetical protein
MNTDRLLGLLIGLLAGTFLCCAVTGLTLALGGGSPVAPSAQIPPGATLDVAVDEEAGRQTWRGNEKIDEDTSSFGTIVLVDEPAGAAVTGNNPKSEP